MSPADVPQIHHIARMAILAMCARGVAVAEFDSSPEIVEVRLTVHRVVGVSECPIDLEFIGAHSMPVGGMSL